MFIGHYGVSFAAKRWAPRVSLGWLFLAVQVLDVLFSIFLLLGIEKMAIVPGATAYNPYDLYFMPYTHGLVGALVWSVLFGLGAHLLAGRGRKGAAVGIAIGACVLSHWVLDLPMHTRDLPLAGNDSPKVGLGLWRNRYLSLAAELIALWVGAALWLRTPGETARAPVASWLFLALLTVALLSTPFMPDPSSAAGFAVTALVAYVGLSVLAAWVDRRRRMSRDLVSH